MNSQRLDSQVSTDSRSQKLKQILAKQRALLKPEWEFALREGEATLTRLKDAVSSARIDPKGLEEVRQSLPQSLRRITDYLFGISNAMMKGTSVNDPSFRAFLASANGAKAIRDVETPLKGVNVSEV